MICPPELCLWITITTKALFIKRKFQLILIVEKGVLGFRLVQWNKSRMKKGPIKVWKTKRIKLLAVLENLMTKFIKVVFNFLTLITILQIKRSLLNHVSGWILKNLTIFQGQKILHRKAAFT